MRGTATARRSALSSAAGACLLLATGLPTDRAGAQSETFEEKATVLEVQVPVHVMSRDGEPVRGLTIDDFELFDEGEPRQITGLRVIDLEVLEPGRARSEIESAVPAAARRHFLLLFDLSFSTPAAVMRAREAAREFVLDRLHPTDLAAVAIHSIEGGPRLVVTFTPDRAQLARAIDTLGAPRLLQLARRQDPLRFVLEDLAGSSATTAPDQSTTETNARQQAVQAYLDVMSKQISKMEKSFERGRVASWSNSLTDLARSLDSVKGRKHVVYFSEGFDGRLMLGRRPDGSDQEQRADRFNLERGNFWMVDTDDVYGNSALQSDISHMLDEFRRANCVIQTVNISGLRAVGAERERAMSAGSDALFFIANETGGELFEDANDFGRQLGELLERSTVTYLLSFEPRDIEFDGSYHRLKLKAELPKGAKMSYREGYYAPRPYQELHPIERELLASGAIGSAEERHDVSINVLAAPFRAHAELAYVPVILEVAGESLLAGFDGDQLPVEIYAYITNDRGEMRDFFTQVVTLDLTNTREAFAGTGLKYYGHLELVEPGEHLIRVLVRNAATGRTGVETLALNVPDYTTKQAVLLPPFFLEEDRRWFLVRERRGDNPYESVVIYPFTVNGEPYVPAARPVLRTEEAAQVCLVAYNLGEGVVELDATVVGEGGEVVREASLDLVERTITGIEGLDKLLASFDPAGLAAGSYELRVGLRGPASALTRADSIAFSIVN